MANYFYTDSHGNKLGPYNEQVLKSLVAQGVIRFSTPLETEGGHTGLAGQIPGLFDMASSKKESSGMDAQSIFDYGFGVFDIGFTRFFSNIYVSIVWVLIIIFHFCGALSTIWGAFRMDEMTGVVSLVLVPLITVISLLCSRMTLEACKAFFRIEKNTRETKDLLREIKEQLTKQ